MAATNTLITGISYLNAKWKRKLISISRTLKGKVGIEIGGPSPVNFGLKGLFPVYVFAKSIDGVNFSTQTLWEGELQKGISYKYFQKKVGYQYIEEATDLSMIADNKYDFLLSSHNLEHVANPIKALLEWKRVLKVGGKLVLVLPDKTRTFDYNRPYTTFQHLLDDFNAHTDENDTAHFEEILSLHDFSFETYSNFKLLQERLKDNFTYRVAHHHVFNCETIKEMLSFAGFKVLYQQTCVPFNLITIAIKE